MSTSRRKLSNTKAKEQHEGNQRALRADHHLECQSSTLNQSQTGSHFISPNLKQPKFPRLKETNDTSIIPFGSSSRAFPTRQRNSSTNSVLPIVGNEGINRSSAIDISSSDLASERARNIWAPSVHAPLASSEQINIEHSTEILTSPCSRTPIVIYFSPNNLDNSSRSHSHDSHQNMQSKLTPLNRHRSQSTSKLHPLNKEPTVKPSHQRSPYLLRSENRKMRDQELRSSIRDIPRLSERKTKAADVVYPSDSTGVMLQNQISAEPAVIYSDHTLEPTYSEQLSIVPTIERKQENVKITRLHSESSLQEIPSKMQYTFHDSLLRPTTVQRGRCGLKNIGNTCFMNSALQCLSNVSELTEYILENDITGIINMNNDVGTHGRLALAYAKLIKEMWSGEKIVAEGSDVKRCVSELSPRFAGYMQQDSHEFLNTLLNTLHEDLKQDSDTIEEGISLISQYFHGQIRSTVTCACGEPFISFDSISFLALPIPNPPRPPPRKKYTSTSVEQTVTLEACLNAFFKDENINENGQWFCNECNRLRDAEKKLDLWTPPQILILQFKRFSYDLSSSAKIQTLVEYPFNSSLDLGKYVINPDYNNKKILYELIAISSHSGSLAGGHYTAYAKNFLTNKWLYFNDENVFEVDEETLLSPNTYFLVYRRQKE